jgi:hypothetical protein
MTALTEGFTKLNVQKASGTVSTEFNEPVDIQSHLLSLKSEIQRIAAGIPQSWMQSGMQAVIEQAVQSMADKLNAEVLNKENPDTAEQPLGATAYRNYSSPEADVESAKDSVRLENDSRRRRA